jgi:menaquinol-cytochrome c reductase iron-sulfur subunit
VLEQAQKQKGSNMANNDEGQNRRVFCLSSIFAIGGVIGAALGIPAFIYLLFPPKQAKRSEWVDAGNIHDLPVGQPKEISFLRTQNDGWKVTSEKATSWVLKTPDNEVVAYSPWCTHLGCAVHWESDKKQFLCPCHGSVFSADGNVLSGPAPRPLDRYEVKLEADELWLGKLQEQGEES